MIPTARRTTGRFSGRLIDQTYLVALKLPSRAVQHVIAASLEIHGENLVFFNAEGELAAMFLMEIVQSWNVLPRVSA
jgi:hypothetical protein